MSTPNVTIPVTDASCPVPPELAGRDPLTTEDAAELENLFKVLASETRLRLLHELARQGECSVGELAAAVDMSVQAVSNQLQRLVDQRVVTSRRDGNHIHYRIIDCCVGGVMELGLCLLAARP